MQIRQESHTRWVTTDPGEYYTTRRNGLAAAPP